MVIPLYKVTVYCNDALFPDSHWRNISESFYNDIGELFDTYGYVLGNNPVKFSAIAEMKYGETKSVYCSGVRYDIKKTERYDI